MAASARHTDAGIDEISEERAEAIRVQVGKILMDPLFRDTTRMKRFLQYVTDEVLAGRGERLKGYTIGVEVFDKPTDFDPQTDTIVRVQAGQLRRRLDLYYAGSGETDRIRLTIPKGRYAPRFEVRDESAKRPIIQASPEDVKGPPSIAVVSFSELGAASENDFFAEGLTTEIISALVQFRHIRVLRLRTSDISPTASEISKTIGHAHDVEFVLMGNVRRAGDVFRVVVSLTSTSTGYILYTKSFDRRYTPDALFELQESIASNVAAAVAAPFGQINRYNRRLKTGRRVSMGAYEAVLRFYSMGLKPNASDARSLLRDVKAILTQNPAFSSGFAIQSMLHTAMVTQRIPATDVDANLAKAREFAERGIRIDGQNGLAYFALFQALFHSGRIEPAFEQAQTAMALNPNDYSMLAYLALTHANVGQMDAAEAYDQSAQTLVSNPPSWFDAARMVAAFRKGDDEAVLAIAGEVREDSSVIFPLTVSSTLGHLGRTHEGLGIFELIGRRGQAALADAIRTIDFWQCDEALRKRVLDGWERLGLVAD